MDAPLLPLTQPQVPSNAKLQHHDHRHDDEQKGKGHVSETRRFLLHKLSKAKCTPEKLLFRGFIVYTALYLLTRVVGTHHVKGAGMRRNKNPSVDITAVFPFVILSHKSYYMGPLGGGSFDAVDIWFVVGSVEVHREWVTIS